MIKKNKRVTQKAAAILRVAINTTVKNSAGRIQGAAKNSSCFFVNSMDKKRPPKLRTNMKQPIIYGFVFMNIIAVLNGSTIPPVTGAALDIGPGGLLAGVGGIGSESGIFGLGR